MQTGGNGHTKFINKFIITILNIFFYKNKQHFSSQKLCQILKKEKNARGNN